MHPIKFLILIAAALVVAALGEAATWAYFTLMEAAK